MAYEIQEKALFTTLDGTEKLTLIALAHFANKETWECWPSQKKISEIVGRSEKQINRLINSLCDKHIIVQMGRHGPTSKYKLFPSDEDIEKNMSAREKRKQKYHAAAVARGEKIKKQNEEMRKAKAAEHPKDRMSEHPMDGMSGYPMDGMSEHPMGGIQTNKENQEENLISNQEENKENNIEESIIKQNNNILESNIGAPPQVLFDEAANKIDFDFDSHDVFKKFQNELSAEFSKQGMGAREITLRLAHTHDSYLAEAENEKAAGWKHVKTTPELWCKGVWRTKAKNYNGYELTSEDLLDIVREHYQRVYPNALARVNDVLANTDSHERILLEQTAARDGMPGAWQCIRVQRVIAYVIEMFSKPMENACSFCIPD